MIEMYLELEGVQGESEFNGAKGAMEVLAFSWGMNRHPDQHANLQDVSMTMYMGPSTTALARFMTEHQSGSARLVCFRPRDTTYPLYAYELQGASVTSLSMGGGRGEDRHTVNTSLTFRSVTLKVNLLDEEGRTTAEFATSEIVKRRR